MALRHESEQSELFPWLHTEGSAQEGLKREPSFREAPAFALGLFCLTLACGVGLSGKREGPGVGIRSPKPPTLLRGSLQQLEYRHDIPRRTTKHQGYASYGRQVLASNQAKAWASLLLFVPSKHIQRGDLLNIQGTQQALNGGIIRVLTGPLKLVTPC